MKLTKIDRKFKEIGFEKTQEIYDRINNIYDVIYESNSDNPNSNYVEVIHFTNDTTTPIVEAYTKNEHKAVGLTEYELELCLKKLKQLNKNK